MLWFLRSHGLLFALASLLCACAAPPAQSPARTPAPVEERPALPAPAPAIPERTEIPGIPMDMAVAPGPRPVAVPTPQHVALVLPLGSKAFASVAEAFKQGFVAAAGQPTIGAPAYRVYVAENEGDSLIANVRTALTEGAVMVVGGLTRDGATALARHSLRVPDVPILALNTPEAGISGRYYFLTLSLDLEARQIAQLAASEGARLATVIHSSTSLARRIQESFEREWQRLGGQIILRIPYTGDLDAVQRIRPQLENMRNDMVFVAAEAPAARAIRPYIPIWMTTYATTLSIDARADAVTNIDLDGVRFLDMPWFVQPDHLAVMVYPRPPAETPIEQERLYALGIDAWRLAQLLLANEPGTLVLDGVTGKLRADPNASQILRTLTPTEFRDGHATPYARVE